jgi:hypothetical protein
MPTDNPLFAAEQCPICLRRLDKPERPGTTAEVIMSNLPDTRTTGSIGKRAARRVVRHRLAAWLRAVGSEPPDDDALSEEVAEEWTDEVLRWADRIEGLNV